jgi:uncharacterized protein YeaO (DUF488 family)
MIKIKRIYEKPSTNDGFKILIDRLWPRGVSKTSAKVDLWIKEIAPSDSLRKWFSHDPKKWEIFKKKYKAELKNKKLLLNKIKDREKGGKIVTLVFSAKNKEHNNAVVLGEILDLFDSKTTVTKYKM